MYDLTKKTPQAFQQTSLEMLLQYHFIHNQVVINCHEYFIRYSMIQSEKQSDEFYAPKFRLPRNWDVLF